jgi:Flavin containing amine oxidoreductase
VSSSRRSFIGSLGGVAAAGSLAACARHTQRIEVVRPGMAFAHSLRAGIQSPLWQGMIEAGALVCDTLIIGSGAAGLTAAWQLNRAGNRKVLVLQGPVAHGNAAGSQMNALKCPTGAHYLPLPSKESRHMRELLKDMGVFSGEIGADRPSYSEQVLVHAPADRLFHEGRWFAGVIPNDSLASHPADEQRSQIQRFLNLMREWGNARGADDRRVFVVPVILASMDPKWRALDQMTFEAWLKSEQFVAPALIWYLDYCCRDEFGAGVTSVSAWAGLHYFCSRNGQAANAADGLVLTWPDGLAPILRHLEKGVEQSLLPLSAVQINRQRDSVQVWATDGKNRVRITARKVIVATPLFVALGIDPEIRAAFPNARELLPSYRPWLVSNFYWDRAPVEDGPTELAWDNVIFGSESLGYVNAAHQLIRRTPNPPTVLTAYHAFATGTPSAARQWCATATEDELMQIASADLRAVYDERVIKAAKQVQITVHGHGMASPLPGFLSNRLSLALREESGRVVYAHSDLSGYSVFEEAVWWGQRAAKCCV